MRLKDEAVNVMGNKNAADYRWILLPLHLWKIIESNYDSGIKIPTTPPRRDESLPPVRMRFFCRSIFL